MTDTRFDRAVWYHDFTALGVPTKHRGEFYRKNQEAKAPVICRLINEAVGTIIDRPDERPSPVPHAVELFCADGFYACYLAKTWPFRVTAIDRDAAELERGHAVAKELGIQERIAFIQRNAVGYQHEHADLLICTGGLYHLRNPAKFLKHLCRPNVKAMVLQAVYSLEEGSRLVDDGAKFESPAEGRSHGSRFSALWILDAIKKAGWEILSSETNELSVNPPRDRGSLYALCKPKEQHSKRTDWKSDASSRS